MRVAPRAVIVSASERKASFASSQRLHRPSEFAAAMAERKVVRGEYFDLHFGLAAAEGRARLGLIVPKRLARTATLRNSIKRQGREAFRLCSGQVPACDLVLRLKRPFVGISPTDELQRKAWRKEIEILFGRLSTKSL